MNLPQPQALNGMPGLGPMHPGGPPPGHPHMPPPVHPGQHPGGEEMGISLNLPMMFGHDDKKELMNELSLLVLDYGIRHWDARSKLVEEFTMFYHIPPPFIFKLSLRMFLNELESWFNSDDKSLLIERVIIIEQCCGVYHARGQLIDITNILRAYIEQLVIAPLYFGDGTDFVDNAIVMYLDDANGGPPVLYKWRGLVQEVIGKIVDVFNQSGIDGVKKTFPKHVCYSSLMEFLDPLLGEMLYQESELEKIMKEFKHLKNMSFANKGNKTMKRKRSWEDKGRGGIKKARGEDGSENSGEDSSSSDVEIRRTSKGRRQRVFWTDDEEQALIKGVAKYGVGNWVSIHRRYTDDFHPQRTPSDLKDKWRNIQNKKKKMAAEGIPDQSQAALEQQIAMEQAEQQRLFYEHQKELMLQQQQLEQHRSEQQQALLEQQNQPGSEPEEDEKSDM
eukprot:TRINITY_DN2152_c0_g1_i1.p1 TRINITY_DN2152_c0_g1~~TRINITY_DN2152_c0_g1_i1.p1  ORF type:complete len:477 (-),score=118.26 TRINITY_DN2152_c0_g1_i1:64-1404(-)